MKNGKVYMKHNSLGDDIPIVVILRAMGAMSDQEVVQLVRGFVGIPNGRRYAPTDMIE